MTQQHMTLDHTHSVTIRGRVEIRLYERNELVKSINIDNLVVNIGKQVLADIITEKGVNIAYVAVGSGTSQVTQGDTALQQEIGRKGITMKSTNGNQARFDTFFDTYEMNGTWREIGLISNDNRLVARTLLSNEINKTNSNTSTISWSITFQ